VEWGFGFTSNLFPFVKDPSKNKVMMQKNVLNYYTVATLLRNAYVCCYEVNTNKHLDCNPPTLEDYFHGNFSPDSS
jgi:hypothetical protein